MNPSGHLPGLPPSPGPSSAEPFVADLSEGAETGVYLALLELLDEGLLITGDEVVLDANSAACRLLGRDYRDVAGRPLADLFADGQAFLAARARLLIEGERRGRLDFALPDGGVRALEFNCAPRLRPGIHAIILSAPAVVAEYETGTPVLAAPRPTAGGARAFDDAPSMSMYLTSHDPLTGLANRRMLEARFGDCAVRAAGRHGSIAIVRLDLDGFAAVNRSLGESAGDEVLRCIARRLAATAGSAALVARERSDSFIVLLPEPAHPGNADQFAETLLRAVAEPLELGGGLQRITASAGLALYPQDGRNLDTLLRNAKSALEQARRLGGNHCSVFHTRLDGPGFDSSHLERGLRHALQADELCLHFQPLVDARSGRTRAGEALLRWRHPELGLLPYRQFMGAVGDPRLLADVGDWVLATACDHATDWPPTHDGECLRLTVNVSVEQLMRGDFAARVATALRTSGLKAERLELDLDEKVLALDSPTLAATLERIAATGVRLSIDDFGRGLSSIPRLRRYPLAALKLDPELVRGVGRSEDSEAIVEAVGALAGTLGLEIYARGVEHRGQQAFLCALDCHLQQGPLFGRPLAAREFADRLLRAQ
ncbi:sensor domain-containing protein [Thauera aminoaromatica]|uniref:Diguanylate cyclase/phosphodiesterase with PAS/PAC sensor(S) n=1 Tax=Thauera aminoaromatica TaxID=164330 RepID=C4ZJL8_THASP|nr:EAL domain-containing protein [Thauera aminoaromatica]ACK54400.1 diguanylate cyclase/phosphodiesterase with PAS/PAC sensor(s) [Thauera aminoaromatica]MCK6400148.1 EAL domain-containing protein [Thauera aminoaromatica]